MSFRHQKKKRVSPTKLAQLRAEYRKHFFQRIQRICSFVGGEEVFNFIPKEELDRIYVRRCLPLKIISAPNDSVPAKKLRYISSLLNYGIRIKVYAITEKGDSLSIFELLTIGISFLNYLENLGVDKFKNAGEVKKMLYSFKPFETIFQETLTQLDSKMTVAGLMESELTSRLYWLEHKYDVRKSNSAGIENLIIVHSFTPEKIYVGKDGEKYRPAFKVCTAISETGIINSTINSSLLGINDCVKDFQIDVYIQMHAIERLNERLDCLQIVGIYIGLFVSLKEPKIIRSGENNYLIEFRLDCIVVGYLVGDIQDGKFIIRTFLFVTQSRTPEGKKLKELYGLGKLDISYIELDKLSTYIYNDLCSNPGISEIFQQAGCQYLLDLFTDSRIKGICNSVNNYSKLELMTKYMGLNKDLSFS